MSDFDDLLVHPILGCCPQDRRTLENGAKARCPATPGDWPDGVTEFRDGAGSSRSKQGLELGKGLLDGIEVWRVGREEEQPRARDLDGGPHAIEVTGAE